MILCCFCTTITPGDLSPRVSHPRDLILRSFSARKYRCFSVLPLTKSILIFPQPQLRRFRSLSNLSIPTFHQFQPVVISIILACFLLAYNTSLLILRIRFQSILRIFLLKHPIRQEISFFIYCLFQFFNKTAFPLTEKQRYHSFFHSLCICLLTVITTRIYPSSLKKCIFSRINKSTIVQTKKQQSRIPKAKKHPSSHGNPQKEGR